MSSPAAEERQPVFYYDLGDPDSYLVAEQILGTLPVVPVWEPVLGEAVGHRPTDEPQRARILSRALELGLQPLRWPPTWPPDGQRAALAATYAKRGGRTVAFSLAAFRQVFAGGRDLGEESTVLIAAAACEMHPVAVRKGIGLRATAEALEQAHIRARRAGVKRLPAIEAGGALFEGEAGLRQAAEALGGGW